MTKVTILGEEQGSEPKKKIEFVSLLGDKGKRKPASPEGWDNIKLLARNYDLSGLDLMYAWENNEVFAGYAYLGHFNDGVV